VRCDRSRATRGRSIAVLIGALLAACATGVDPTGAGGEGTGGAAASGASGGGSGVGSGGTGASSTTGGSSGIGGAGGVGGTGASGSGGTGGTSATGGASGSGTGGSGTGGSGTGGSGTGGSGGSGTGGTGTCSTGGSGTGGSDAGSSNGLTVHYRRGDANSTDEQLRVSLEVVNGGTDPVPLTEVTVRYWYTKDSGSTAQTSSIDYAAIGRDNINRAFTAVGPVTGADFYIELSFTAGAGTLAGGASTGDIQLRINKDDYSPYSEADDWSYVDCGLMSGPRTPNDHITAYQNGTLVWGTEPQ
jgi:hypothetical protein